MKSIKKILVLLCVALMLFSMSGCRDSSVIEKIIYDYLRANQTDMEKDTFDDKEDNELDDKLNDLEKDEESDRENDEEEVDPVYAPEQEPTQENTAGKANYEEDSTQNDAAAVEPTTIDDGEISGGQSTEETDSDDDAPPDSGEGISDEEGEIGTSSGNTTRLVVDDYGRQYEVPQNVDTVAAVDSAAVAVLMLGGVDRLVATNEDLTSDSLATAVFPGLSSVPALWSGSGTTASLSSSDLQRLIELHPDVCLETSGKATFTDAQVKTLQENGICYVVIPAPSSIANVKMIAQIIGGILGDHTSDGGYDSVSVAESYRSWVNQIISSFTFSSNAGAAYTLYVDAWDTDAYYTIDQASTCYGYGAAVINNGRTDPCKAVSDFLAAASVTNVTSLGSFSRSETIYFTPFDVNYSTISVTGSAAGRLTPVKLLVLGNYLGSDGFQTVIAGSNSVKEGLENNELWKNFGTVTSSNGNFTDYGFLDDYGEIVRSTISGDYTVIVNPYGIGDWASGSVESILEPVWASYAVLGTYSEDEVRNTISEFYSKFYHYDLSEKQLDAILAGEA